MQDDSQNKQKIFTNEENTETPSGSFGDTQGLEGFLRLVQFVKKEHQKKQQMKVPEFQLRKLRIEQYSNHSQIESAKLTSGTQLKKAA